MMTVEELLAEFERAFGFPPARDNGHHVALCPACAGQVTITEVDGAATFECSNGCDRTRIGHELHFRATRSWNERVEAGGLKADEARRELEVLYGLDKLGLRISSARIVGTGSRASADIYLEGGGAIRSRPSGTLAARARYSRSWRRASAPRHR